MLPLLPYKAHKGRTIDLTAPVKVYKNLHNGLLSVMQAGLVVAHVETITLRSVNFVVNASGRQRVLAEQKKNVHAFVTGFVDAVNVPTGGETVYLYRKVSYNPYKCGEFTQMTNQGVLVRAHVAPNERLHCNNTLGLFIMKEGHHEL